MISHQTIKTYVLGLQGVRVGEGEECASKEHVITF